MKSKPSPNGRDGKTGRFTVGNPGGPGNPHSKAVGQLRSALLETVTPERFKVVVAELLKMIFSPDTEPQIKLAAISELLDRVLGKPVQADLLEKFEDIEQAIEQLINRESKGGLPWN